MRGGQGGSPHAPATPLGFPLSYKRHPLLTSHSQLLVKDLSPPLEFIPMVSDQRDTCSRWLFGKKELCFHCIAGARRRRLLGASDVCASTDALLFCGARTSSPS